MNQPAGMNKAASAARPPKPRPSLLTYFAAALLAYSVLGLSELLLSRVSNYSASLGDLVSIPIAILTLLLFLAMLRRDGTYAKVGVAVSAAVLLTWALVFAFFPNASSRWNNTPHDLSGHASTDPRCAPIIAKGEICPY